MYDSTEEIDNRLSGTICMYDGKGMYMSEGSQYDNSAKDYLVFGRELPYQKHRSRSILLNDPKFQYKGVPLGYANVNGHATYFVRKPVRRYKQGISQENLLSVSGMAYGESPLRVQRLEKIGWNVLLQDEGFAKMFHGEYPSFQKAVELAAGGHGTAFSRDLAIGFDLDRYYLWNHGRKIAWSEDAQRFALAAKYKYFHESLIERNIPVE